MVVIHGDPNKPDEVLPGGKWDEDEFETLDRLKDALSSLSPDYKFTYLSNHDTLIDDLKHLKATTKIDLVFQVTLFFIGPCVVFGSDLFASCAMKDSTTTLVWNYTRLPSWKCLICPLPAPRQSALASPTVDASQIGLGRVLMLAKDKQNVTSIAKSLGLPVPASVCIEDDKAILQHGLAYPVFIKPNSTDGSFGILLLFISIAARTLC